MREHVRQAGQLEMESPLDPTCEARPLVEGLSIEEGSQGIAEQQPAEQFIRVHQEQEEIDGIYWLLVSLYCSHFLARWGNSMWDFAVALFMIDIWPESLLLGAIYGLVESAVVVSLGVTVGNWVDNTPHLKVVRLSLAVGNGSIMAAGIAVLILLLHPGATPGGSAAFVALVSFVDIIGGISKLGLLATDIVVERDWVVVISEQYKENGSSLLSKMNAVMRRIDLCCKLLAPVAVGFLMSSVSVVATAIVIAAWNLLTAGLQYHLLFWVYRSIAALQVKQPSSDNRTETSSSTYEMVGIDDSEGATEDDTEHATRSSSQSLWMKLSDLSFIKGWRVYLRQEVVLAAIALAILYFTVLSFGPLMTSVLQLKGVPPYVLGLARGVASLVGIAATVAYPAVHAQLGPVRAGLWAIWIQWSLLAISVASILVSGPTISAGLLIGGVSASRFGLWMFDLAVTQVMQESVAEQERGIVGGVQSSVQSFMNMLPFIVAMCIPDPQDFWIPITLSYLAVTTAAILYAVYTYRVRGHLFHLDTVFSCSLMSLKDLLKSVFLRF